MGEKWPNLKIISGAEVIVLHDNNRMSKIFPPKAYRQKIMEAMHKAGRRLYSMF